MNNIILEEVYTTLEKLVKKDVQPIELIKAGIEILQPKHINKNVKKEILIVVLEQIAYGNDGIPGTNDDRLSQESLHLLKLIVSNSDVIHFTIKGIIATIKKTKIKKCWPLW